MVRSLALAGGGVQLLACAVLAAPAPPALRLYVQTLEVEYPSATEAARASLAFAPVYDAREWAFSARWDDCNLNSLQMRQHMAKFGLKGTFYLTQNDAKNTFGPAFCKQLLQDGFSIGGHTMTHPKLPELNAGQIWWELCANRIAREDDTEMPLNSLAFSYGQFRGANPEAFLLVSEATRRTGYHHCVYADFVRGNPNLAEGEFSTGCQVVPGDKVVDAAKFQEQLEKPVSKWPEAYQKWSHCIFLGVHPWQTGAEWDKLEAVFQTLAGKPEWWYCNQTEWAAYARQVARAMLQPEAGATAATTRRYALTRLVPGDLGAAVPLTCVVSQANVVGVKLDGQPVPGEKRGDQTVINLPHTQDQALPQRIGHIEVPATAQALADSPSCADFPGLQGLLLADPAQQQLSLTLAAPAGTDLRDLYIRFRLPLQYEPGIVSQTLAAVKPGTPQTVSIALPTPKPESFWTAGPQYWVAEIDFTGPTAPGRLFVTRLVP
jgi:hypothetical protein